MSEHIEVLHNPSKSRFEVHLGDQLGMVEYQLAGNYIIFTHTEVPSEYEGKGIANELARVALEYAKEQGLRVQALCPFIKLYIQKHEEYQPITFGY